MKEQVYFLLTPNTKQIVKRITNRAMKGVADNNTIKTPPITQTNKQQKRFL
jgi:hypothetical protein